MRPTENKNIHISACLPSQTMRISANCSFDSATLNKHCNSLQVTAGDTAYIFDTNSSTPALINKHCKIKDLWDPQTYVEPGFAVCIGENMIIDPSYRSFDKFLYKTLIPNS